MRDLLGQKFGKLTVIGFEESIRTNTGTLRNLWKCRCECGNEKITQDNLLITGKVTSCGCGKPERMIKMHTKHGGAKRKNEERLYSIWRSMKRRCANKNDMNYGGRGISVCDEWQDYQTFKEWAYNNGYDDKADKGQCTIDRINNDGNYEPSNCRWITRKEQNNNMTSNVRLTHNRVTHNLTEWSKITGISYPTLQGRVRRGWKTEDILFKPINKRYSHSKYKGE